MTSVADFMARVVPWPSDGGPGYINIHYTMPDKTDPKKTYWGGKPTRALDDFLSTAQWANKQDFIHDIYFCLSRQKQAGLTRKGKPKPVRNAANADALKAIWLDVDVKTPPKGYARLPEALAAIRAFVAAYKLPAPTALVASGGGVHVYWINKEELTPLAWSQYANSLKSAAQQHSLLCDYGVTSDSARVLRVPDTQNYKTNPPKAVRLLALQENDYDFVHDLAEFLLCSPAPVSTGQVGLSVAQAAATGVDPKEFPPRPSLVGTGAPSLAAGIRDVLDPLPVLKGCKFLYDALKTGGKDYHEPMWYKTLMAASFFEDGNQLAHKMSQGHASYDFQGTQEKYEHALRSRHEQDLGWPSCASIADSGSTVCGGCVHFQAGKSPLNLAVAAKQAAQQAAVTAAVTARNLIASPPDLFLPEGYELNGDGYICKIIMEKEGKGETAVITPTLAPLFTSRITSPWAERGHPERLNFMASVSKGHVTPVSLPMNECVGMKVAEALTRRNVKPVPDNKRHVEGFLMAWITKLHELQASMSAQPFGWLPDLSGFAYGGYTYRENGTQTPAGYGAAVTADEYRPMGDAQVWRDTVRLILDQQHTPLDVLLATGFGAPILRLAGNNGGCMSAWSEGGEGKSAATKLAQAIWGNPRRRENTLTTAKSMIHKMGTLKNLPLYWDEVKDPEQQKHVVHAVFGPDGSSGGRLNTNIEQRERLEWETMMIVCSNISLREFVKREHPTHAAALHRVLEFFVPMQTSGLGRTTEMAADIELMKLEMNYGMIGLEYVKLIMQDWKAVQQLVLSCGDTIRNAVGHIPEERIWIAQAGATLAGAIMANKMGIGFDIERIQAFLIETVLENRAFKEGAVVKGSSADFAEAETTHYLKTMTANTAWTDVAHMGPGVPTKSIVILAAPRSDMPKPCWVHCAVSDRTICISQKQMGEYYSTRKMSSATIIDGLKKHFGAKVVRMTMCGGTPFRSGREYTVVIPVPPGSPFEPHLTAYMKTPSLGVVPNTQTGTP